MDERALPQQARRVRIYVNEGDRWHGKPLDMALLEALRAQGVTGATVFRAAAGFGANAQIHTSNIEVLSYDLPVVIEVVDTPEKIETVLPVLASMVREGLITGEDVQVLWHSRALSGLLPSGRLVSEAMTTGVISFEPHTLVKEAWQQMLDHRLKAAPVVDADRRVVGIVTDEDLLARAGLQQRLSVALRLEGGDIDDQLVVVPGARQTIGAVMTHPVVTAEAGETLSAAAQRMIQKNLKRLPVLDPGGRLVGMLSRLDVLRSAAQAPLVEPRAPLDAQSIQTIAQLMTPEIPSIAQTADLVEMIEAFARRQSNRLVVVDQDGVAVGLVSDSDVVARVQPVHRRGILDAFRQRGQPPQADVTARELMSPGPLTVPADLSVVDAIRLMLRDARKWLVVVDAQGRPLGLVDRQLLFEAVSARVHLA